MSAAQRYLRKRDLWTAPVMAFTDAGLFAVATLRDAGRATDAAVDEERARFDRTWGSDPNPVTRWAAIQRSVVRTPGQAKVALSSLPADASPTDFYVAVQGKGIVGHMLLLGGRPEQAIPWLRAETRVCWGNLGDPINHTRAFAWLGQALEQTGDTQGACQAYAVLLERWGKAKPRSITVDEVRKRVAALKCRK